MPLIFKKCTHFSNERTCTIHNDGDDTPKKLMTETVDCFFQFSLFDRSSSSHQFSKRFSYMSFLLTEMTPLHSSEMLSTAVHAFSTSGSLVRTQSWESRKRQHSTIRPSAPLGIEPKHQVYEASETRAQTPPSAIAHIQ